jgi:DNA-binding CsgD family transcriptional regulator
VDLTGRRAECGVLDRLVEDIRAGESRALVVYGEAGVGKTALLDYVAEQAAGCRVIRASGVESEMELAFAGLHQLCAPILDLLAGLPVPQRDALQTALGMRAGAPPDLFFVGLAVLSLLSEVAQAQPFVCVVDDEQWLDRASAQVLAFVARRLMAESVGLIIAARVPSRDLVSLPELVVTPLRDAEARALLDAVLTGPLDTRVRDQIVAETEGNPLALLELPRGLTPAELAGGFGIPGAVPLERSIEENFRRRVGALPVQTQKLLLVAAAEPVGDPASLWRAAAELAIEPAAAAPAIEAALAVFGTRVRFHHPLVRSAVYRSASAPERQRVHQALAEATDPRLDPERRAWHRAEASPGPDDDVAAELERSAGRAQARGGLAAAAAFLQRAATLTLDPAQRARRALAAAQAAIQAGGLETAPDLLAMAELGPLDEFERARVDLARAQLAFVTNRGSDAPPLLLRAATRLEAIDVGLSRATYLDALSAAIFAGRLARPGGEVLEVARAARAAPRPPRLRAPDFLLDGLAAICIEGYPAAVPMLREGLALFRAGMSAEEELRWLWPACIAALRLWDHDSWDVLSARHVDRAREAGALTELLLALTSRTYVLLFAGEMTAAASLTDEIQTLKDATGSNLTDYGRLGLAAFRGDETGTRSVTKATMEDANARGEGVGIGLAEWLNAVHNNGLGHYENALAAAQRGTAYEADPGGTIWPAVELIEAAARSGMTDIATDSYHRLAEKTSASGTDWALGIQARSHALLRHGEDAERLYRESIACLGRTRVRTELARVYLLYGEWLRRQRRRSDAREALRTAYRMFESMGMEAFAERAGRELRATGETARKRTVATRHAELTAQEAQVARLARDGLSNPEIGTRLFISAHTVQYHLRKVFVKLGINTRSQLDRALPSGPAALQRPGQ